MLNFPQSIPSQITFLYYTDLAAAQRFYAQTLGLALVEDQGWAKIYRVAAGAFVGIVDEAHGSLKARPDNAVMLTFVVDDVRGWYDYLRAQGVTLLREYGVSEEINIEYFFIQDPGGYTIEFQKFLNPALAAPFGLTST